MTFADPRYLVVLAVLLPLGLAAVLVRERRRRADLETFGEHPLMARSSSLPSRRARLAADGLCLVALALLLVAQARPQLGATPVVISRTGRDVVFALDLSRSMNAEDVKPSRLRAARSAVREILAASPDDRVGLVIFGGSAFLQVPLTLDHAGFELFLDAADTDDVSDPGTDLGAALATASSAFGEDSEPRYRAVVLLSDGEDLEGAGRTASRDLRDAGVRVFALGMGTPEGGPIPLYAGRRLLGYHRDETGEAVVTRLAEDDLREVASQTGGSYTRWRGGAVGEVLRELSRLDQREISSRTFARLADRYQWPLAAALVALLAEWLLTSRSGTRRSRGGGAPAVRGGGGGRRGSAP
ncbi:MAG: VWA domain-containing protein [Gemmatimonadetes bacterium]|nr:VWA domain-containing protein [Gemmatimonadota bacterium]